MREKLLELMKNEGLKSSHLADMLGINPAGISHILAGRNKPGFELLQKILLRFPRISPDWLLLDKGPMYRDDEPSGTAPTSDRAPEPRTKVSESATPAEDLFASRPTARSTSPASAVSSTPVSPMSSVESFLPGTSNRTATVKRIVIFYDDNSFEAYFPTTR